MTRLWSAILLVLLTLRLTFVGADLTCADHNRSAAPIHNASERDAGHASSDHIADATPEDACEIPTQPDCCAGMTSCAIIVAFGDLERGSTMPAIQDAIESAIARGPAAFSSPPDPPPPKA